MLALVLRKIIRIVVKGLFEIYDLDGAEYEYIKTGYKTCKRLG